MSADPGPKPATCRKCGTGDHIRLADAGVCKSIPYWYCGNCKEEVDKWGSEVKVEYTIQDLEDEFQRIFCEEDDDEQPEYYSTPSGIPITP